MDTTTLTAIAAQRSRDDIAAGANARLARQLRREARAARREQGAPVARIIGRPVFAGRIRIALAR